MFPYFFEKCLAIPIISFFSFTTNVYDMASVFLSVHTMGEKRNCLSTAATESFRLSRKKFGYSDKASEKISSVILKKYICPDVKQLSSLHQTSICEALHSVVINFAPKSMAFTYKGMLARYAFTVNTDINF